MPFSFRDCCRKCTNCCSRSKDDKNDDLELQPNDESRSEPRYVCENPAMPARSLPPSPTDEGLGIYKALWSFKAQSEGEMSFMEKDVFRVTQPSGEWWKAEKLVDGAVVASGFVPYNYLVEGDTLDIQSWYFGKLNRFETQTLLLRTENPEGTFLVRRSDKEEVGYVLSVKVDGQAKHFKIHGEEKFCVEESRTFPTVEALVKHYRSHSISTICKLTEPCARRKPEQQNLSHVSVDEWEVPKSEFVLKQRLGTGNFAEVYLAQWNGKMNVAIKVLKENVYHGTLDHREFLLETQMLKKLRHRHLITLFAVCTESTPFYIITELMEKGNLLGFLRGPEGKTMDTDSLTDIAFQVADGMAYLESENVVHRDLAARNILVGEGNICKVADFGLARVLKEPFYVSDDKTKPYKWCAPEALSHGRFSSKSDVWSFGILLYEIFSRGAIPYPTVGNNELFDRINSGYRMPRPGKCPSPIYDIMKNCWSDVPADRPNFEELKSLLQAYDE
ncbi:hypothetical protein ACEWY4_000269 [Coilia grayii]|uniref:Tyrosine-protein kinase n=1 Tax=Coilia grayii TaxID=363190 RepID=A0ABD1KWL7_9TELE